MIPILIKTYDKDSEWLFWCLRSIQKYAQGMGPIYVLTERSPAVMHAVTESGVPVELRFVEDVLPQAMDIKNGYIRQQYCKLMGDVVVGSDHIQVDSDVVFTEPIGLDYWGDQGRPIWFYTPFEKIISGTGSESEAIRLWKTSTEHYLGYSIDAEHMRCPGFWMLKDGLLGLRAALEVRHRKSLVELLVDVKAMSEYNIYGAWCHAHIPHRYTWLNTCESVIPPRKMNQFWSYGGITPEIRVELTRILSA